MPDGKAMTYYGYFEKDFEVQFLQSYLELQNSIQEEPSRGVEAFGTLRMLVTASHKMVYCMQCYCLQVWNEALQS